MTMTDPVFEGVYGTYTIDATDRREVLGYRLALTAAALGQAGLLVQWRPRQRSRRPECSREPLGG